MLQLLAVLNVIKISMQSDLLEEMCWSGKEALHLYRILCNISGVWDCTAQASEANIAPTLVRLEESDYTSVGVFLPDYLVQKMEGTLILR